MGKKDYRQGAADTMKAFSDFEKKNEAAILQTGAEVGKVKESVERIGGQIGEVVDYITGKEKAELYQLNTSVDIADLEDNDKHILLAILFQLVSDTDDVTPEQQNYLRSVQQYLEITNPQTRIELEAVENIEDISAQKAVLQAVLEFFYLGTNSGSFTDDQQEFLDYFNVNKKGRREIQEHIDAIVKAVGPQGLAEKYGYVPEPELIEESEDFAQETGEYEEITLDGGFSVPAGETVRFCNKKVDVRSYISCEGTLEFVRCDIASTVALGGNTITVSGDGSISFESCSIHVSRTEDGYFISCEGKKDASIFEKAQNSCTFSQCRLLDCNRLLTCCGASATISGCYIQNPGERIMHSYDKIQMQDSEVFFFSNYVPEHDSHIFNLGSGEVKNCSVQFPENTQYDYEAVGTLYLLDAKSLDRCSFEWLSSCKLECTIEGEVKNSKFTHCEITLAVLQGTIHDCIFEDCRARNHSLISGSGFGYGNNRRPLSIKNCSFSGFWGETFWDLQGECEISYCIFENFKSKSNYSGILSFIADRESTCTIEKCYFDNIETAENYLIDVFTFNKLKHPYLHISDCTFYNCRTEQRQNILVRTFSEYIKLIGNGVTTTADIRNCVGITSDGILDVAAQQTISPKQQLQADKNGIGAALGEVGAVLRKASGQAMEAVTTAAAAVANTEIGANAMGFAEEKLGIKLPKNKPGSPE